MALEAGIAELVNDFIAAGRPSTRTQNIEERRAGYVASTVLAGEMETRVQTRSFEHEGIRFWVASPLQSSGSLPAVVYYHGGCFISGGVATHEKQLRQLAYYGNCHVIAVEYRLAPEFTFPAAHDDALKGAEIVWRNASLFGVQPDQITLAGDSAGGHLALVTALRLKTSGQWLPAQLLLIYPMLDATASCESYIRNGDDYVITRDTLTSGYELYLADLPREHPEASPLWRDDFSGLPPVHIITAEYDPLCDEGKELYRRVKNQGVNCSRVEYTGVIHGFFQLAGISESARRVVQDVARRIAL
ncbi:alpha/beta hydrolase [Scandinavium goeteborgense]|uniref:alpha/beta hydrolase n=1 Tax=Scandinavium goeteborgense TaxID=1851514 RepID=UPI000F686B60|nr:alpha/beta hydrolase [Scandinavium goeteborgense]QKN83862.1 alpha/beta hydrolase [Scandinavium goeteborgense]